MSTLHSFHTFAVMKDAIATSASSEATDHPAEHAISPLEPNFAWEANEVSAQHTLVVDLGETRVCDGFSYIHHETEETNDVTEISVSVNIDCEKSSDGTNWTTLTLAPQDDLVDSNPLKIRYFVSGGSTKQTESARYWRFTVKGQLSPNFYAPTDARISMCWLFGYSELDRGAGFPMNDTPVFPTSDIPMPYGKQYRTGYSVNPHTTFSRVWMVTTAEYEVLKQVMRDCHGKQRPFILQSSDSSRRLCNFASDEIGEELLDIGLWRVTINFVEVPIVGKDGYH